VLSSLRRLKSSHFITRYPYKHAITAACVIIFLVIGGWATYRHFSSHTSVTPPSVISVYDILNTDDFIDAAIVSFESRDAAALDEVFERAVILAREAGLDAAKVDYLQSEQAFEYVSFRAKREMYWRQVEWHYRELLPISPLKQQFPEAQDLFAQADALEQSRAQMLLEIATALAAPDAPVEAHQEEAKRLWRARHQAPASHSGISVN